MKVDLHTHTLCSKDSCNRFERIVAAVQSAGIDAIAVTDHDRFDGVRRLQEIAPFPVIAGEEIKTAEGEIIGLFLTEWIPPGLTPEETIERIKSQGGVVYVPHPFDEVRGSRLRREALERIAERIDVLEVFNARNALPRFNQRALAFARDRRLLAGAGSDTHTYGEYGRAYVEIPPFSDTQSFLASMREGSWYGRLSSPLVHLRTRLDRTLKILGVAPDSPIDDGGRMHDEPAGPS
ncbi:MAG TPA: PHP-associated domain-containing protein [Chloroflexota bacterium]|nr:PHP-associated domain-containing protein [Chloroflexota bacterium]